MNLTKTDFKEYLICPECLWLKKKKPAEYTGREITVFLQKLIADGYEVEEKARELFPAGVFLAGSESDLLKKTKQELVKKGTIFQATFKTDRGLFVKVDILKFNEENGNWDLYEVKSSSSIKTDLMHNHIKDISFQKITLENSGIEVGQSYIVHLNKEYKRKGELDLIKLFVFEEVSEKIAEIKEEVEYQIDSALELLEKDDLIIKSCDCLYKSVGQRCDCFRKFNPQVPEYSTAHILRGKKLRELVDDNIFDPKDIPADFKLTDPQRIKVELQKVGKVQINTENIRMALEGLKYPLYFLDYETILKAIPSLDGYKPNQQVVFQYSLHLLDEKGVLKHFEYLAEDLERATTGLVQSLRENLGETGTVIVWHQDFEKARNNELGVLHSEYKEFFDNLNKRVFDLKVIFQKDYLHPRANGSASIKKVLPVMIPELSYKNLAVQDGTMAMSAWEEMLKTDDFQEKNKIKTNLLKYCELDTLAMVKIFEVVNNL
ncbi:MAG: DUF2779 domain-containing protein [Candidatus Pacebacteria bacterium]|nr:DUF2779 domain-containing protein [Candidatus Paceibacterota bacterium]